MVLFNIDPIFNSYEKQLTLGVPITSWLSWWSVGDAQIPCISGREYKIWGFAQLSNVCLKMKVNYLVGLSCNSLSSVVSGCHTTTKRMVFEAKATEVGRNPLNSTQTSSDCHVVIPLENTNSGSCLFSISCDPNPNPNVNAFPIDLCECMPMRLWN